MKCPRCGASLDASNATCPSCGAAVLDVIVAAKVQEALAKQASDQQRAEEESEKATQRKLLTSLVEMNARVPRSPVQAAGPMFLRWLGALSVGWLLFGVLVHFFVFGLVGRSPAGLACPLLCDGCKGPGRVFSWDYEGSWESAKGQMGYAFLCQAPGVDVDQLGWYELSSARNAELQPFLVNGFLTWAIEGVLLVLVAAVVITALRLIGHEEKVERRQVELQRKLDALR